MNLKTQLTLADWYARNDLFERSVRRSTFAVGFTVIFMVALVVLFFGLAYGYRAARRARLNAAPQTRSIFVGHASMGNEFSADELRELQQRLEKELPATAEPIAVGFHKIVKSGWQQQDRKSARRCEGRSLSENSPLFLEIERTTGATENGIYVTKPMLEKLGAETISPPNLAFHAKDGSHAAIPIAGVIKRNLLEKNEFLVPEGFYPRFLTITDPPSSLYATTGPLAAQWLGEEFRSQLSAEFDERFIEAGLEAWIDTSEDGSGWQLRRLGDHGPLSPAGWEKEVVPYLEAIFREKGIPVPEDLPLLTPVRNTEEIPPEPYDDILVYVSDIQYLSEAIRAIKTEMPRTLIGEDRAREVEQIDKQFATMITLLVILTATTVAIAFYSIYTTLVLRSEQHIAPIGMLKTMGMDHQLMMLICALEGVWLWIVSALPGVVIGIFLGKVATKILCNHYHDQYLIAYDCPILIWGAALLGSLTVCVVGIFLATRFARNASPHECLSVNL